MSVNRIIFVVMVIALGLILARLAIGPLYNNIAHVVALKAFSSRFPTSRSLELLQTALSLNCSGGINCGLEGVDSEETALEKAKEQFVVDPTPMLIVKDSVVIPSDQFLYTTLFGFPMTVEAPGVLYGPGTLNFRPFLYSEQERCWQIAVKAKHDDPPPVELEVLINRVQVGTLSFDRGDQSWEVLSINVPLGPNLHALGITFANDYLDKEAGIDRNAYIEYVEINQVEDSFCAND